MSTKKLLFIAILFLLWGVPTTNAQVLKSAGTPSTPTQSDYGKIPCSPACTATQTCSSYGVCVDSTPLKSAGDPSPSSPTSPQQASPGDSGFVPLAPIPGLTEGVLANSSGLASFLQNLYKYLIGLAAIIAVIEIIRGGIEISTQDSVSKQGIGRQHITQAILGLVLVLAPVLVFSIINPSILNLSLNLPPLDTATNRDTTTSKSQIPETPASGCQTGSFNTGTARFNQYIQVASCATPQDAETYAGCSPGMQKIVSCGGPSGLVTQKGDCASSARLVVCEKSISVEHYSLTTHGGLLHGSEQVIPRDASTEQPFVQGCLSYGGQIDLSTTILGTVYSVAHRYASLIDDILPSILKSTTIAPLILALNCPSDAGVTYDPKTASGVVCYGVNLTCIPPTQ